MSMSKVGIKPLFDYVLIKPIKPETVTASGIVLPDTNKEKPQVGEVMAVGPGDINHKGEVKKVVVKVGDVVLYKKWGGNEVKYNNVEYMLIEQKDIMAVEEN
jgi:chaperonin GroES